MGPLAWLAIGVVAAPFVWPIIVVCLPFIIGGGVIFAALIAYLVIVKHTTLEDFRIVWEGGKVTAWVKYCGFRGITVDQVWDQTVARYGVHRPAIHFVDTDDVYTFGNLDGLANATAHFGLAQRLPAASTIALFMTNRPEFFATWMGFAKIGVRSALINTNLTGNPLIHSITSVESSILVFEHALAPAVEEVLDTLNEMGVRLFCYDGETSFATNLQDEFATLPKTAVRDEDRAAARGIPPSDPLMYIYTSGTTGLPKAANVSHYRYLLASNGFGALYRITDADRVYITLPLYHSAANMLGLGYLVSRGATAILRSKFSASAFTKDVQNYDPTIVLYIGELARYLLAAAPHPDDANNNIRLAIGNGLRADIWAEFKARFGIQQIGEFYAATEGAAALLNTTDRLGSIGRNPEILQLISPTIIAKYSVEDDALVLDANGRVIPCDVNEPGEYLVKIKREARGFSNYSGYTDKKASNKKIIRGAVADGDEWFRSGDLLRMDETRHVYFVDRIGDTFRWKGENVATGEVGNELTTFPGVTEANVYGVEVPDTEGRAGMAALVGIGPEDIDLTAFAAHVTEKLAPYARPVFLRFQPATDTTGTFKHKKNNLQKEGFDPSVIEDPLYFLDTANSTYSPITPEVYEKIVAKDIRI